MPQPHNSDPADLDPPGPVPGEAAIRGIVDAQMQAIRDKDADALMAHCAEEILSFDVVPPLRIRGSDAVRARLTAWFSAYDGPIGAETRELAVAAAGDVGFCHGLQHFTGTMTGGTEVDMWVRVTMGLRRIGDRWLIVHEHMSDPFDPDSGQALTGLEP